MSSVLHRVVAADSPSGWLLRLPLRLIPEGTVVPILASGARGMRWIAGSGPHSCWLGFNELGNRRAFRHMVRPGAVVFDVGANVGSYTLLASALVGPEGRVVSFEPVPENLRYLEEHIRLNRLTNVDVRRVAVGARSGEARFRKHGDRLQGRVDEQGGDPVSMVALDDLLRQDAIPRPDVMKIDVEGGELDVLRGAFELLRLARPSILLSTHGTAVRDECLRLLEGMGYATAPLGKDGSEWLARPG